MEDQVHSLLQAGVAACHLSSAQDDSEVWRRARNGDYVLIYMAPERVEAWADSLEYLYQKTGLTAFAIDEAHCISEWGHDFRSAYLELGTSLRRRFPRVPIMALTATATMQVQTDLIRNLRLRTPWVVRTSFDRPNLTYSVRACESSTAAVAELIRELGGGGGGGTTTKKKKNKGGGKDDDENDDNDDEKKKHERKKESTYTPKSPCIVYCTKRRTTDEVAAQLVACGIRAAAYHAGSSTGKRSKVHRQFLQDDIECVVATVAFGMGIDKPDIRRVIHLGVPKSIESYYQQTGRAGRDGAPSECILFYAPRDLTQGNFLASTDRDRRMAAAMRAYVRTGTCRRRILLSYFNDELKKKDLKEEGGGGGGDDEDAEVVIVEEKSRTQKKKGTRTAVGVGGEGRGKKKEEDAEEETENEARDEEKDNCGKCDNCVAPPVQSSDLVQVSDEARHVARAIKETGERFGLQVPLCLVRGSTASKIVKKIRNATRLKSFGQLKHRSDKYVKALGQMLTDAGVIEVFTRAKFSLYRVGTLGRRLLNDPSFQLPPLQPSTELKRELQRTASLVPPPPPSLPPRPSMIQLGDDDEPAHAMTSTTLSDVSESSSVGELQTWLQHHNVPYDNDDDNNNNSSKKHLWEVVRRTQASEERRQKKEEKTRARLLEVLTNLRKVEADIRGLAPYQILGTTALQNLATYKPTTDESFNQTEGIGESGRAFSTRFTQVIKMFATAHGFFLPFSLSLSLSFDVTRLYFFFF